MKKIISVWGILSGLFICLIIAFSQDTQTTEQELEWEPIPEIIETAEIEPTEIREHEFIIHYEPIEPVYKCREFTQEEAVMLMKIAQAEAGDQGVQGMMLIMQVVINRTIDPAFPDTIKEVIEQDGQFETVRNGTYQNIEISAEAHLALAEIEKGVPYDGAIIGFETASNGRSLERYFLYAYTRGGHDFYVTKKN